MIKIQTLGVEHVLKPTIFPDGTSQVWKLPEIFLEKGAHIGVKWNFESERELLDLCSLATLTPKAHKVLFVPYLPYARQDKLVANDATFNLAMFGNVLNKCVPTLNVYTFDAHNLGQAQFWVDGLLPQTDALKQFHRWLIEKTQPEWLLFPDNGARERYAASFGDFYLKGRVLVGYKVRDQKTGIIKKYEMTFPDGTHCGKVGKYLGNHARILVVDDICDGGATFELAAEHISRQLADPRLFLGVSHGIFSKGRKPLEEAGFEIFTTNSLLHNEDGYEV